MKKRIFCILLAICLCLSLLSTVALATDTDTSEEIVILYTNDIHTYIDKDITYSRLATLKDTYENVLLVDAGDHIQGTAYGSMDKGATIVELMNAAGYDAATLGNHEFDYGMNGCEQVVEWADYTYLSCNFHHEQGGVTGDTVLDAYKVFEVNGTKIAIIGITTPETFTSSTPAYFQDENGNYIYGIAGGSDGAQLYAAVQSAIDAASQEADVIIALGHLGIGVSSAPWRSVDVIANTTGLDAFIDGHSHSTVPMQEVADRDGNTVILTQTGEYLGAIGEMTISDDGITTKLLTTDDLTQITPDAQVKAIEDAWISQLEASLGQVIGTTELTFDNYDTDGNRLVRKQETNTGDFAADALYYLFDNMGMDVDVAIMNGGGVRNTAITGDISYETCKQIHTFGNVACLQTVTGQQILDALEWGARFVGVSEEGSFLQVSGITYQINTAIANTTQADDKGVWTGGPTGEYRVHDVKVYNKETGTWDDLDLGASYNLAGYNYTLRDLGGGFAMLDGATNVLDYVMEDYMVLANYVQGFENGVVKADNSPLAAKYDGFTVDYSTVNGSGRITVETVPQEKEYPVWVGGQQITESNMSGDGWSYDADSNMLTLEDYTYSGQGYNSAGIYAEDDLNITLKGENQISSSGYYGIYVKDNTLTIAGDGKLDVEGSDFGIYTSQWDVGGLTIGGSVTVNAKSGDVTSGSSYGIRADGALIIRDNAVVNAKSGYAPARSCGLYGYTTLDICDNAVVTAESGSSSERNGEEIGSYGIRTTYMTVSGGELTATGADAKYASCGIYTQTFAVSGGSVTATGGTTDNGPSVGIQSAKSVDISGGTVKATGGNAAESNDTSGGILTSGPLTVSGGTVTAETGSGGFTRAIQADTMTVTGGTVTATAADAVAPTDTGAVSHSSGIQVSNGLFVEAGTVTATGGNAATYSYGIQSAADAVISGGSVTAESGKAGRSYGFWAMGHVTVENGVLKAFAGEAVSDKFAYSVGLCTNGGLDIDFDGAVIATGGKSTGKTAYSIGVESNENNVQVYSGVLDTSGDAVNGTADASSIGVCVTGGGVYAYESGAKIYATSSTAEAANNAISNGIRVNGGDVGIEAGYVEFSTGTVSGADCERYAVCILAQDNGDGSMSGGYLSVECDEVVHAIYGAPRLDGTTMTADGPIFVEMGIEVGEKLTVSLPEGGQAAEVTGENGAYYTIVEEDSTTVAEKIEIKPLGYTVLITGLENTLQAIAPAGKSLNETYREAFGIENFGEKLNVKKDGYTLEGWYTDEAYTEAFDFDMPINEDITLYAKWTALAYSIKLESGDGGSASADTTAPVTGQTVTLSTKADEGKTVDEICVKDKDYKEIAVTDNGDGTYTYTQPAGDVTITVSWKTKTYTVTYVADGKTVDTVTVEHGEDAVAPKLPAKKGYTAVWDKEGKNITSDTTITAVYTKVADTPDSGSPNTGDNSNLILWITLLAVSSSGLLAAAYCAKKRICR